MFTVSLYAQDHYWGMQYGGQATLMGGTAVVGVNDNSCLYYNPGALGFIDSARLTASTHVYGFEFVKLKNGAGTGRDLKSVRVNILPQLLAGRWVFKKLPRLKLVFGTLTRGRTNLRFAQDNEGQYEIINGSPGLEYYKSRVEFVNNSVEQWAGFGLAYQLSNAWSVGFSSFGAYTHIEVRSTENSSADAIYNGQAYTTTVNEYNAIRLNQITQIFKLGVTARFKHVQVGMAVTLPGIKIWSEAKLEKSFEAYNLNLNASDTNIAAQQYSSYIISDVQRGLRTRYQIPLSASFGLKLTYPEFTLSLAMEYFMGSKQRIIARGTDRAVIRPASVFGHEPIQDFMLVKTTAGFVVNGGIGAEVKITPMVNALFGTRTDFTNHSDYLPLTNLSSVVSAKSPRWHYLYFSTGVTYKLQKHNLTAGIDYGIGLSAGKSQVYNLNEPSQNGFLRGGLKNDMHTSAHKFNFILSYVYFFKAKEKSINPVSVLVDEIKKSRAGKKKK